MPLENVERSIQKLLRSAREFFDAGKWSKSEEALDEALNSYLSLDLNRVMILPKLSTITDLFSNVGFVKYKLGKYPEALYLYIRSIEIEQDPNIYILIGKVHEKQGNFLGALQSYKAAADSKKYSKDPKINSKIQALSSALKSESEQSEVDPSLASSDDAQQTALAGKNWAATASDGTE